MHSLQIKLSSLNEEGAIRAVHTILAPCRTPASGHREHDRIDPGRQGCGPAQMTVERVIYRGLCATGSARRRQLPIASKDHYAEDPEKRKHFRRSFRP